MYFWLIISDWTCTFSLLDLCCSSWAIESYWNSIWDAQKILTFTILNVFQRDKWQISSYSESSLQQHDKQINEKTYNSQCCGRNSTYCVCLYSFNHSPLCGQAHTAFTSSKRHLLNGLGYWCMTLNNCIWMCDTIIWHLFQCMIRLSELKVRTTLYSFIKSCLFSQ